MGDSPWWVLPTPLKKSDQVLKIGPSHKGKVGFLNSPTFDLGELGLTQGERTPFKTPSQRAPPSYRLKVGPVEN